MMFRVYTAQEYRTVWIDSDSVESVRDSSGIYASDGNCQIKCKSGERFSVRETTEEVMGMLQKVLENK